MCLFTGSKFTIPLTVAVEGLGLSLRIGEVLGSNICFEVIYSDCIFRGFLQIPQANVGVGYLLPCCLQIIFLLIILSRRYIILTNKIYLKQ